MLEDRQTDVNVMKKDRNKHKTTEIKAGPSNLYSECVSPEHLDITDASHTIQFNSTARYLLCCYYF